MGRNPGTSFILSSNDFIFLRRNSCLLVLIIFAVAKKIQAIYYECQIRCALSSHTIRTAIIQKYIYKAGQCHLGSLFFDVFSSFISGWLVLFIIYDIWCTRFVHENEHPNKAVSCSNNPIKEMYNICQETAIWFLKRFSLDNSQFFSLNILSIFCTFRKIQNTQ